MGAYRAWLEDAEASVNHQSARGFCWSASMMELFTLNALVFFAIGLLSMASLYMIFFICLLVSGSRKLKERVIWRSLGKPIIRFFADSCLPLLVNMGLTLLLSLLYSHFRGKEC